MSTLDETLTYTSTESFQSYEFYEKIVENFFRMLEEIRCDKNIETK
jgi:hypothetical protein